VFYPGLLAALCLLDDTATVTRVAILRWPAMGLTAIVTVLAANAAYRFGQRMEARH